MRLIPLFICFVCLLNTPRLSQAQSDFQRGSFILKDNPQARKYGNLKVNYKNLILQIENDKTIKYPLEEVLSYQLGLYQYIRASGFPIQSYSGFSARTAENDFVVLLDSGAVSLMRYEYFASGINGSRPAATYLLQRAGETQATPVPISFVDGAGKGFLLFLLFKGVLIY
jgi:hypothetical protein